MAEASTGDAIKPAIRRVTDLRDAGARWGLIALDLEVPSDDVVAALDDLGDKQIAVAERAVVAVRDAGAGAAEAGGIAGAAATSAGGASSTGSTTVVEGGTGDSGSGGSTGGSTGGQTPSGGGTAPTDDPPPSGGGKSPGGGGDTDPGPGGGDDDGEETPLEAVEKVVSDVVREAPSLPGGGPDEPDLPLPKVQLNP